MVFAPRNGILGNRSSEPRDLGIYFGRVRAVWRCVRLAGGGAEGRPAKCERSGTHGAALLQYIHDTTSPCTPARLSYVQYNDSAIKSLIHIEMRLVILCMARGRTGEHEAGQGVWTAHRGEYF